MDTAKIKTFTMTFDGSSYVVFDPHDFASEVASLDADDECAIRVTEHTRAELDAMGEFGGF